MRKRQHKFPPEGYKGIVIFFPIEFHQAIEREVLERRQSGVDWNKSEQIANYAMKGYHSEKMKQL